MNKVGRVFLVLIFLIFAGFVSFMMFLNYIQKEDELAIQQGMLKIQEEAHIDNLYTVYQNNISACRGQAREAGRDAAFIQENCINPVNQSIIGQWLQERGYGSLLE